MRIFVLAVCSVLLFLGCKQTEPTSLGNTQKKEEPEPEVEQEPVDEPEPVELVVPERVFGIPVPREVISVVDFRSYQVLKTTLDLDQVERFFSKELVDFEVIRDKDVVRIVGLRGYMGNVRATYTGRRSKKTVSLRYYPADTKIDKQTEKLVKPKKGDKVELTTAAGEKLAPGAKWFEPYTPPVGSPLHKPRYKNNFGTPFGKWRNN